jgi:predicted dehydrogenase
MLAAETGLGSGAAAATGIGYELHRRQLADMVEAVTHDRPPAIDGVEARRAVAIICAIYDSHARGGWVKLA